MENTMDATNRKRRLVVLFFAHVMLQNDFCYCQIWFVIGCNLRPFIFQKWLMEIHKFQCATIHWFQNDSKIQQQPQHWNQSNFSRNLQLKNLRDSPLILELSLRQSSLLTKVSSWQATASFSQFLHHTHFSYFSHYCFVSESSNILLLLIQVHFCRSLRKLLSSMSRLSKFQLIQ